MEFLLGLLKSLSANEIGLVIGLIGMIGYLCYFFYKEITKLHKEAKQEIKSIKDQQMKEYKEVHLQYKNDRDKIVKEMFETLNKNTEANTKLAEAVRDLTFKIK